MQVIQRNAHESLHWSWDGSDHEWNTKIRIKYNIVCYKFYNNLKYEILEYKEIESLGDFDYYKTVLRERRVN